MEMHRHAEYCLLTLMTLMTLLLLVPASWPFGRFPPSYFNTDMALTASLTTKEEAAKLMAETSGHGYGSDWHAEPCDARCTDGVCRLRADSPRCCTVPRLDADRHYAETQAAGAGVSTEIADADSWSEHERDLYCWR
jgi:hypothetical protein